MSDSKGRSVITATGCYIPETIIPNSYFLHHQFLEKDGAPIKKDNPETIATFKKITGIETRRYANPNQRASDLGLAAANAALQSSGLDKEMLDYIIVAHNFGDITANGQHSDLVPTLASRVKYLLQIENPDCIAYDLPFGCPGWLQALIQADYYIRSGDARHCLVIGTETLSRVTDAHDRDTMLYGDGSGAVILSAGTDEYSGLISHKTCTFTRYEAMLLHMGPSFNTAIENNHLFLKMNGRKLYEFALTQVPAVVKAAIDKAGLHISDIHKVLIHQANEKMDEAILERLLGLYGVTDSNPDLMPMTISRLGNSSVATIPTLLDLICKGQMPGHHIEEGDIVVFASVGAGMNINAAVYRFPPAKPIQTRTEPPV
jgi:3-oxoacyl-[acyl-carrier-protein] synthase-3